LPSFGGPGQEKLLIIEEKAALPPLLSAPKISFPPFLVQISQNSPPVWKKGHLATS